MKRSKREEAIRIGLRGTRRVIEALNPLTSTWTNTEASITERFFRLFVSHQLSQLRYRRRQQEQIHRDLENLRRKTSQDLPDLLLQAYDVGRRVAATGLDEQIAIFTSTDRATLLILERNLGSRLSQSIDRVGRRVDDVFRRLGVQAARDLVATGTKDAPTKFARELAKSGITTFEDTLGRSWSMERYASVAIRSTVTEAIARATKNYMMVRNLDIVEINRSADPCAVCLPYDGRTFSLSGTSDRYPGLNTDFPIHPLCEHFMFPKFISETQRDLVELGEVRGISNA